MRNKPLNTRQLRFVGGVIAGKSAKQAYIDAGYTARGHTAESCAEKLLRNAEIQKAIDAARQKAAQKNELSAEWVLRQLKDEAVREGDGATHSARVRALELIGKQLGMFGDKLDVTSQGERLSATELKHVPYDELRRRISELRDRVSSAGTAGA